jgi:hypothetical protein
MSVAWINLLAMSNTGNETRTRGKPPTAPKSARGRAMLLHLTDRGLTLYGAAKKARLTFPALYGAIHGDPAKLSVKTVTALCSRLGMPLSLVAPQLADLRVGAA